MATTADQSRPGINWRGQGDIGETSRSSNAPTGLRRALSGVAASALSRRVTVDDEGGGSAAAATITGAGHTALLAAAPGFVVMPSGPLDGIISRAGRIHCGMRSAGKTPAAAALASGGVCSGRGAPADTELYGSYRTKPASPLGAGGAPMAPIDAPASQGRALCGRCSAALAGTGCNAALASNASQAARSFLSSSRWDCGSGPADPVIVRRFHRCRHRCQKKSKTP